MKIAFVTTQRLEGSTNVGRILPLAQKLAEEHDVHLLVHGPASASTSEVRIRVVGKDPFTRTDEGKKRLGGIRLIVRLKLNALKTCLALFALWPDVVVIVKPLPQSVFAVWLWRTFNRKAKIVLDVDDFELSANVLSSLLQRAAVHWAQRLGARLANHIVAASPFLHDHFEQLTGGTKKVTLIPTGISDEFLDLTIDAQEVKNHTSLLYIGSISISSGHRIDLLPEILAAVRKEKPETTLTIAGSGDDIALMKAKFRNAGLEKAVTWTGRFANGEVSKLLRGSPILLDPVDAGISNRAKSSFRVMLAAAVGLPVVTSNIGIRPLLVPDELHKKFFADPENSASYAARTVDLLSQSLNVRERELLRARAWQYAWEELSKSYARIITV